MYGRLDPFNNSDRDAESSSSTYILLFLLAGLALATYAFARFAESRNRLNYESRSARMIAGFLVLMMRMLHTGSRDIEIIEAEAPRKQIPVASGVDSETTDTEVLKETTLPDPRTDLAISEAESKLYALGPHRTGWEAIAFAAKIKGTPPHFFATDAFNAIPGVESFLKTFKAIPIKANATKGERGQSANADALVEAGKVLSEKGCVALFPQGNFARLGQEPHKIYAGVAILAVENNIPIHVIRLDGFWSIQNPLIPLFIRNSTYYRAFLSAFHMNNVRATLCSIVDFHLKPENQWLTKEEKIKEICAELYAYYRHTGELSKKQIGAIGKEISDKTHLLIWENKVKRDALGKQLTDLKKEGATLEEETSKSMMRASMQ